jgi:hypothetical protein
MELHISHVLKALGFFRVIQKKVKAQINRNYRKLNLVTGSGAAPGAATKPKARCRYGAVRRHARLSARGLVARADRRQTEARVAR